jgi:hypothetical protein
MRAADEYPLDGSAQPPFPSKIIGSIAAVRTSGWALMRPGSQRELRHGAGAAARHERRSADGGQEKKQCTVIVSHEVAPEDVDRSDSWEKTNDLLREEPGSSGPLHRAMSGTPDSAS